MSLPMEIILFLLVFCCPTNSVICEQHGNSTISSISPSESSLNPKGDERSFDTISRQKRDDLADDSNFYKWYNDSLANCKQSLKNLIGIESLEIMLHDVFFIDSSEDIHLHGDLTFDHLSVADSLKAPDVKSLDGFSYVNRFSETFLTIDESLKTIENEVGRLNGLLETAMRTNGNQEVSGNITFSNAYFDCGDVGCNIKSIETSTFNGRDVKLLSSRVIRLDQNETLNDSYNFSRLTAEDMKVELINEIAPSEIVTRDGDFTISGNVRFANTVRVKQLNVIKTVNGNEITRGTVLTKNDPQVITTPVTFSSLVTIKDLHVDRLDQAGSNFSDFLSNVVQMDQNRPITGKKTLNHVAVDKLWIEGDLINGFNVTDLNRHMLARDDSQTIAAKVTVDELTINGDIQVERLNDYKLEELIVPRKTPIVIRGTKIFTGPVRIGALEVEGKLNERFISNRSLGLMLNKGPQVITGSKNFADIEVRNLTLLHGDIGPLSFEQVESKTRRNIFGGKRRVLTGPVQVEEITVSGKINGISLDSLMKDFLKVNQSKMTNVNLHIAKAIFKKPLKCDTINNLKFPGNFITKSTDQTFSDDVYISSQMVVTSGLNLTQINGFDLDSFLLDSLNSSGRQDIVAPKTISGNLFVKNLSVRSLNSIKMKDLVLLSGNGIVLGNKTFTSINVNGPASVDSIFGVRTINSIPTDELFSNSITKRDLQTISPTVRVKKLVIPVGTNVNVTELAGTKLNDVLSSVVYLKSNVTQIIKGKKRFTAQATFGNLIFNSTFAGYSSDEFKKDSRSQSAFEIKADISIDSDLFIDDDLTVTGHVNEIDTNSFVQHFPVENKPIIINRPMHFRHVRVIGGNVESRLINGLKFSKEIVTRRSPVIFDRGATFPHGLNVSHLTVGMINGVEIQGPMCSPLEQLFSKPYSLTVIGNVETREKLTSGLLYSQKFNERTIDAIRGVKKFNNLNIAGPIHLKGRLNNFDVEYLKKSYLSRTKNQTIDSEVIFRNATFSGPVYIDGHLSGRNVFINGDYSQNSVHSTRRHPRDISDQRIASAFYFPGRFSSQKRLMDSSSVIPIHGMKYLDSRKIDELTVDRANSVPVEAHPRNANANMPNEKSDVTTGKVVRRSQFFQSPNLGGLKKLRSRGNF